ncbi:hypothetical protein [Nonomuraea sp. NPDC023979]|uniref:hypothetical protein n=1 Tax=Nonomuraea sp. NPDC023979 TaxID=3154796 RepID=UPI003401DB9A
MDFPLRAKRVKLKLAAGGPHLPVRPESRVRQIAGRACHELIAAAITADAEFWPYLPAMDVIVVNHSGGKDSSVALHELVTLARRLGLLDRVVVLHNDLGRVEWPSTAELDAQHADYYRRRFGATLVELFGDRPSARGIAEAQAARYGLPFFVRSRTGGDLLQQIEQYGKFPDAANRHCTSEQKRAPKFRLFTELVQGLSYLGRKVRILDVNGERAEESTARAKKPAVEHNRMASNKTKREVFTWRIVHHWTLADVWACHEAHDLDAHWAYAFMSRLSCSICILGAVLDVTWACAFRPDLADDIAALEARIQHLFKNKRSIIWYIAEAVQLGRAELETRMAERQAERSTPVAPCQEDLVKLAGAL